MDLIENIRLAFVSIKGNMTRAVLTLMIIAFGIMALVGILTAIDSAIYSLSDSFARLGANSFSINQVRSKARRRNDRRHVSDVITYDQAMNFKEKYNFNGKVAVSMWATGSATVKYKEEETNPNVMVDGINENYLDLKAYELAAGRNFSNQEINYGGNKAIVGKDIVESLFDKKTARAMDKTIVVGNQKFKIIGVLESKGNSMGGNDDRRVLIPLQTAKRYYGTQKTNYRLAVNVANALDIDDAISSSTGLMRNIRRLKASEPNDFEIFKSDGLVDIIREDTANIRLGALIIALMTLLGAAIGLMNIMLVSVTERTREIGVIKALGATRQSVLIQFLTEAVIISLMGGFLGIILGVLMGNAVTSMMGGAFLVPWNWIAIAIALCTFVGLASGLYPAMKAAKQDPIEALRYE